MDPTNGAFVKVIFVYVQWKLGLNLTPNPSWPTRLTPMAFMLRIRSILVRDWGLIGTLLLLVSY